MRRSESNTFHKQVLSRQRLLDQTRERAARNATSARNARSKARRRAERIALLEDVVRQYLAGNATEADLQELMNRPRAHA